MTCSRCGNQNGENINFCRHCGSTMETISPTPVERSLLRGKDSGESLMNSKSKDPDELTGKGIGNVIIGDGFFMVAVILSATTSSVSSLLWLFLLIPAFFFFGKGIADVLHARQIRQRLKQNELSGAPKIAELPSPHVSFFDTIKKHASGELAPVPSVTEKTTRKLK
jgi:hypothetical protein